MEQIDIMEQKIAEMEIRMSKLEDYVKSIKQTPNQIYSMNDQNLPLLGIPEQLIEKINKLDESKQFPILWFYSNKPIMTVKEFLSACATKGFILSHVWFPSEGGHFLKQMVKTGILHEVKVEKSKERFWTITDVGKIKIAKMINDLKNN